MRRMVPHQPKTRSRPKFRFDRDNGMSGAEKAYQRDVLNGAGIFEPITLKLSGNSRYCPDFLTIEDGVPTLTEVKGTYHLPSHNRAQVAFHEAASQFPFFNWVWAELQKGGSWKITRIAREDPHAL